MSLYRNCELFVEKYTFVLGAFCNLKRTLEASQTYTQKLSLSLFHRFSKKIILNIGPELHILDIYLPIL